MRFSVACNFDKAFIEQSKGYPVEEVFGKLPEDYLGGGRSSYMLQQVKKDEFSSYVKYVQDNGVQFNYLLNAPCFNNREFTMEGQKTINEILDFIEELNIKSVTVSSPFLLQIIKKRAPQIKVRISVFACVDNPLKVSRWEELGADCITLDSLLVNRDFETLKKIRQSAKIDLQIMVNNSCLMSCAMCHYHNSTLGHSSQSGHQNMGFITDFCMLKCSHTKLQNPVNYLRCEWVRPEDIHYYEEMGYENFKIIERSTPTPVLLKRVKAYYERSYDGNLLDLVQPYAYDIGEEETDGLKNRSLQYMLRPEFVNVDKLSGVAQLYIKRFFLDPVKRTPPVYIDNKKLDGFINGFIKGSCRYKNCNECLYCHKWAKEVIEIDDDYRKECLALYDNVFDTMLSGELWDQPKIPKEEVSVV